MRSFLLLALLFACSSRPPVLHEDPQALAYRSRSRLADTAAEKIAAEALGDARRRPAWSEPNHVHASGGTFGDGKDKFIFGEARLYLGEYETDPGKFRDVAEQDDAVMALADAAYTMAQLTEWAKKYGVEWDVQIGRLRGRVGASGPDAKAQKLVAELSRRAGRSVADAEAARPALDAKYRDRR